MSFLRNIALRYQQVNTSFVFLAVSSLLLSLITLFKFPGFLNTLLMRDGWFLCMDYIHQGILYQHDPYCAQGPVLFYSLYAVYTLFKDHIYFALSFVGLFLNLGILFLLRAIIMQETQKKAFLSLILVYSVIFYYPYFSVKYGELLSTFFFLMGLYLLFYTSPSSKENFENLLHLSKFSKKNFMKFSHIYLASLFFFLALFTKFIVVVPLLLTFLYALYTFYKKSKEQNSKYSHAVLLYSLSLLIPFLLFTLLLWWRFPSLFYYVIIAHTTHPYMYYSYAFHVFFISLTPFTTPYLYFTLLSWIVVLSCSFFYLRRSVFSLLASLGLFISFLKFKQTTEPWTLGITYFLLYFILFLIELYIVFFQSSFTKKIFLSVFILLFLAPFLLYLSYDIPLVRVQHLFSDVGIDVLSTFSGSMLLYSQPGSFALQQDFPMLQLDNKNITLLNPLLYQWDGTYSQGLLATIGVWAPQVYHHKNLSEEDSYRFISGNLTHYYDNHLADDDLSGLAADLSQRKYDLVLITPGADDFKKAYAMIASQYNITFCSVAIPFLSSQGFNLDGEHLASFVFKDPRFCKQYRNAVADYYRQHYPPICSLSGELADEVQRVLSLDKIALPSCTKRGTTTFKKHTPFTPL